MITSHIFLFFGLIIVSYLLGCHSFSRLLAKSFRSLNIYKIGSGHPDTENIYSNVSKPLGILAGMMDFCKIYFYFYLIQWIFLKIYPAISYAEIQQNPFFLTIGFFMLIGHCLPVTHHFKGGRGIFTYMGLVTFFAPYPMIIIAIIALLLILFFHQIRFAQYIIVLLPPFINFFFPGGKDFLGRMFIVAILMGIMNFFVSKRLGEI